MEEPTVLLPVRSLLVQKAEIILLIPFSFYERKTSTYAGFNGWWRVSYLQYPESQFSLAEESPVMLT